MRYVLAGDRRAANLHVQEMGWDTHDWLYVSVGSLRDRRWQPGDELWMCHTWHNRHWPDRRVILEELGTLRMCSLSEMFDGIQDFPDCRGLV